MNGSFHSVKVPRRNFGFQVLFAPSTLVVERATFIISSSPGFMSKVATIRFPFLFLPLEDKESLRQDD